MLSKINFLSLFSHSHRLAARGYLFTRDTSSLFGRWRSSQDGDGGAPQSLSRTAAIISLHLSLLMSLFSLSHKLSGNKILTSLSLILFLSPWQHHHNPLSLINLSLHHLSLINSLSHRQLSHSLIISALLSSLSALSLTALSDQSIGIGRKAFLLWASNWKNRRTLFLPLT